MQTIPYTTPDGIIELVRKDGHDAVVAKLEAEINQEVAENTNLRQSLHDAKKLAGQLAEAASKCRHWHDTQDGVIISAESFWNLKDALAAYESAKKGSLPDVVTVEFAEQLELENAEMRETLTMAAAYLRVFSPDNPKDKLAKLKRRLKPFLK